MTNTHFLPDGTAVEVIAPGKLYTIKAIHDLRLDSSDVTRHQDIYRFMAPPSMAKAIGERKRFDSWILDENLRWMNKDRHYWKGIYRRSEEETFMPGTGVYSKKWNGKYFNHDNVFEYWKGICRALPIGEQDIFDPKLSGLPVDDPLSRWGPRTQVQWLKVLRFWIRKEHNLITIGVRRELSDYPPKVESGLRIAIDLMTRNLDFVDNIRFAETSKKGEMRRFRRAAEQGCCGSEERYVIIGDRQYIIGCNYGH